MSKTRPAVSIICPTIESRKHLRQRVEFMADYQTYPILELLFDKEPGTIGEKRNRLCDRAKGDVIIHMDDDDLYATYWIEVSVAELIKKESDMVGLSNACFTDIEDNYATWEYKYGISDKPFVLGATMVYWKETWRKHPFEHRNTGEDVKFQRARHEPINIVPHNFKEGFLATIHEGNTCKRIVECVDYTRLEEEKEKEIKHLWEKLVAIGNATI